MPYEIAADRPKGSPPYCPTGAGVDLPGLIAAFNSRDEMREDWQARDDALPWSENWWFNIDAMMTMLRTMLSHEASVVDLWKFRE